MIKEVIVVRFKDETDDIIMTADSIAIYDTTEGTIILQAKGYVDRVIPKDKILSMSLTYVEDNMPAKDIVNKEYGIAKVGRKLMIKLYYNTGATKHMFVDSYRYNSKAKVLHYFDKDLSNGMCPREIHGTVFMDKVEKFEIINRLEV